MEGTSRNNETCRKLLDLIPKERKWMIQREDNNLTEKKLELRLAPPGEFDWSLNNSKTSRPEKPEDSLLSLGLKNGNNQQNMKSHQNNNNALWFHQQGKTPFHQKMSFISKESSQACCPNVAVGLQQQNSEKKAFSPPADPAVSNSSQKRTAPGPVVGWPPIRSFRKNLASTSSSKQAVDQSQNGSPNKKPGGEKPAEANSNKGLFVKINMDGVPIGRKVDLKAYDSYEKLSTAVDELFTDLLAAQKDSCAGGIMNKQEEGKAITGALDGSGEYTLVYEDNEGDRMLVGDVPWHMFVSTVKRLRVLKSSEVSALSLGSTKQEEMSLK